jgi:RimJ/RimL family protein N-acetyltransferase
MAIAPAKALAFNGGTLLVRCAEVGDSEQLSALIHRLASETDYMSREPTEVTAATENQRQRIQAMASADRELLLVAMVDAQMVGTLGFDIRPLARFRHQGEFGLGVVRDFWGRGVGTALVQTLCDWADSSGLLKLTLRVDVENERAVRLYERLGFVVEGRLRKDSRHAGGFRDAFVMARIRELEDGA